jgi:hypothetical protein
MRTRPVLGEEVRVRAPPSLLAAIDQAAGKGRSASMFAATDIIPLGQPVST